VFGRGGGRMGETWVERLGNLFACLGQDPLDDAPALMDFLGTRDERAGWLADLDAAEAAVARGDPQAVAVVNRSGGYRVTSPSEAGYLFRELRQLYLPAVR
jgi:hypothetical protein